MSDIEILSGKQMTIEIREPNRAEFLTFLADRAIDRSNAIDGDGIRSCLAKSTIDSLEYLSVRSSQSNRLSLWAVLTTKLWALPTLQNCNTCKKAYTSLPSNLPQSEWVNE
jgi:hypothetical protein